MPGRGVTLWVGVQEVPVGVGDTVKMKWPAHA